MTSPPRDEVAEVRAVDTDVVPKGPSGKAAASPQSPASVAPEVRDVVIGGADLALSLWLRSARVAYAVVTPPLRMASRAPLPRPIRPDALLRGTAQRGARRRRRVQDRIGELLDELVPAVAAAMLSRLELTQIVLDHVDLDTVVAAVDVDAIVSRVDADAIVNRVDVDAIVNRVDLDAAVAQVDIDRVLDRIDLTEVVLRRVDLQALVTAVLAATDLVPVVQEIIEAVDLPTLVRESTGTMASDSIRGARLHAIAGDETVKRTIGRLLPHRDAEQPPSSGASPDGSQTSTDQ